jgi:hypothetical protein
LPSDSASQPETTTSHPASMPTSASTSNNTAETQHQHREPPSLYQGLSANFAHDPKAPFPVNYDQEVYLQLMAGEDGVRAGEGADAKRKLNKTPTQIYREVCFSSFPSFPLPISRRGAYVMRHKGMGSACSESCYLGPTGGSESE